ncbi:MAG: hypothetical protein K6A67_06400 [Bacteroidales bacterium]|nr:hypothetical protein [Bacteroidales bacterium]
MERFELQQLRDLPIEEVAWRLGMEVTHHKALCPFHDDHHASLSFNVKKNCFRCFVCEAKGGTIDLVMKVRRVGFIEACRWLASELVSGFKFQVSGGNDLEHETWNMKPRAFDAHRYERFFERPWLSEAARQFLFGERRLDERVVRWCRLTSWRDKNGVDWLQIPYYDREGHLVGIQNRNLVKGAQPRFRFPTGSQCGIYNLPVLNRLHEGEDLWITEGCSDCWAMLSAGHKAIAIPSATLLKPNGLEPLLSLHSQLMTPFHMCPDRDEPGERLFLQLQRLLPNLEHHQLPAGCKDYGEYYVKFQVKF